MADDKKNIPEAAPPAEASAPAVESAVVSEQPALAYLSRFIQPLRRPAVQERWSLASPSKGGGAFSPMLEYFLAVDLFFSVWVRPPDA